MGNEISEQFQNVVEIAHRADVHISNIPVDFPIFFKKTLLHLQQNKAKNIFGKISMEMKKSTEKSAAILPESESGSTFAIWKCALML